ncbi:uncharacterized protein LOC135622473 isoform X2 [Musa acuminata AAA Group]|uniref:uncharacterized protein LOC135592470 isoform X2 n=1 Tax=Musa acuminata AAA Group TaxID=214697 RepID=UPI0031E383D9
MWRPRGSRRCSTSIPCLLLIGCVLLYSIPGILSSRIVSLGSIVIFTTHEWLPMKPIVYFHCQGENKTVLPDVKEKDILYTFRGEESWQPLTQLPEKKCKRCGFYEQDTFKADDVFDEWELCAGNFVDGKYVRKKNKEFNATFICPRCTASDGVDETLESKDEASGRRGKMVTVIIICVFAASFVMVAGIVALYKYWQKRKREQDQARFLKLFDEGDDIEDELGLGYII